jgi:2-haloalkanoic acid dehalogenase type II
MPRPAVVLFDVNETLSDLEPLRARFESVGAPGYLLETWFASTLRDGIALAAAGAYAEFRTVALGVLRGMLAGVEAPDEAAEHILEGFGELDVHPDVPDGIRMLADTGVHMATLTNGAADVAEELLKRPGSRISSRASCPSTRCPAGSPRTSRTNTRRARWASRRRSASWSPCIPGTSTAPSAPDCKRPG